MWEDDITYCYNSKADCEHKDCFRHISNRKKPGTYPDICTMSYLKDTPNCPYYKEGNNVF